MELANAVGSSIINVAVNQQTLNRMGEDVRQQIEDNTNRLNSVLDGLEIGESGSYTSTVQGLARSSGTLGQFSIWFEGDITKTSENDWSFSG